MASEPVRVGLLRRGDRRGEPPPVHGDKDLAPLIEAFTKQGATTEHVVWADDASEEIRSQLLRLDGVIVWVNPIQDGATREHLDPLLREVNDAGVWVSALPDVIGEMATKEVLYRTRHLGWGSDTELYRSVAEFRAGFPRRLAERGRLVVKQSRGNGGNGVWRVELLERGGIARPESRLRVLQARGQDPSPEETTLEEFVRRCEAYFAWSGSLIDQEFQERLDDGMVRCYFTHDRLVGFARQWPKGLLDPDSAAGAAPRRSSVRTGPDDDQFQLLRRQAEEEWVPGMCRLLGLAAPDLPVIWDADFLFGPRTESGEDTYVLCEINASAVLPFPAQASDAIASAAVAQIRLNR